MSDLMFPFLWCAVQVTVISAVGLIVAIVTTKRRPDLAARIASVAAVAIFAVTMLVPVSRPVKSAVLTARNAALQIGRSVSSQPVIDTTNSGSEVDGEASEGLARFQLNPASLLMRFTELKHFQQPVQHHIAGYLAIGLIIGIGYGIARLLLGLVLLHRLRRRGILIRDDEFLKLANRMIVETNIRHRIKFAQSDEIGCAAVVGFIRPTVLVSDEWKTWSSDEQRAVLAHELAHICRRDVIWRFLAAVCQIVHFYNPLMHWLAARLILAQELTADRMATSNAGGVGTYLRSLSRLALQIDARPTMRAQLSVTAVFSGDLIRRVEMLRAMDCKLVDFSKSRWSSIVIASIMIFGLTTTAMRGFAEADADGDQQPASAVKSSLDAGDEVSKLELKAALFHREKVPATHPVFTKRGALFLNLAALRQTHFWPIAMNLFNDPGPASITKDWDFNAVDSVSSDLFWNMIAGKDGKKDMVAVGAMGVWVKTIRDVDWHREIHAQYDGAIDGNKDGVDYVDISVPLMGPGLVRLHGVSPRELAGRLVLPVDNRNLGTWINPAHDVRRHSWSSEWDAVSGGLFTAVMEKPKSDEPFTNKNEPWAADANLAYECIDLVSIGIDIIEGSSSIEIKLRLRCNEKSDPEKAFRSAQQLIALVKDQPREKTPSEEEDLFEQAMIDTLASAKIQLIRGEPNVIECQMSYVVSPELLAAFSLPDAKPNDAKPIAKTAEKPEDAVKKQ